MDLGAYFSRIGYEGSPRQLGFQVDRVGGAAARAIVGDSAIGNHMVLIVHLDGRKIVADVGLGDGPRRAFSPRESREVPDAPACPALARDGKYRPSASPRAREQARPRICGNLELDWLSGFSLSDGCACSNFRSRDQVTNFELH